MAHTGDKKTSREQAQRLLDANPCLKNRIVLSPERRLFGGLLYDIVNKTAIHLRVVRSLMLSGCGVDKNSICRFYFLPQVFPFRYGPLRAPSLYKRKWTLHFFMIVQTSMTYAYDELSSEAVSVTHNWAKGLPAPHTSRWNSMVGAISIASGIMADSVTVEKVSLTTFSDLPSIDVNCQRNMMQCHWP